MHIPVSAVPTTGMQQLPRQLAAHPPPPSRPPCPAAVLCAPPQGPSGSDGEAWLNALKAAEFNGCGHIRLMIAAATTGIDLSGVLLQYALLQYALLQYASTGTHSINQLSREAQVAAGGINALLIEAEGYSTARCISVVARRDAQHSSGLKHHSTRFTVSPPTN